MILCFRSATLAMKHCTIHKKFSIIHARKNYQSETVYNLKEFLIFSCHLQLQISYFNFTNEQRTDFDIFYMAPVSVQFLFLHYTLWPVDYVH